MDDFEVEIKTEFINEALMNLEEAEGSFMELESTSDSKPLLEKIFRLAHNLKGGSRAVGLGDVAEFTHELENLVLKIQKGEVPLSPNLVTTLLRSNDRLVEMLSTLKGDMAATFNNADLLEELRAWLAGRTPEAGSVAATPVQLAEPAIVESSIEPVALDGVPPADAFFSEAEVVVAAVSVVAQSWRP